jgi:poly(A) polymerase
MHSFVALCMFSCYDRLFTVRACNCRWAKKRGLYGNKLGYLGGVNCNILVAFVCQLYPNASPSTLLGKFFRVYAEWDWPKPVMLNHIMPPPKESFNKKMVWNEDIGAYHHMPIITPAYPAMNSSEKVVDLSYCLQNMSSCVFVCA